MIFQPYLNHVEIKPIELKGALDVEDTRYLEMGEILSVYEGCTAFKVGDIICFENMVHTRIPKYGDEPERHVVQITERGVNGKYETN